ncbi:MAG: hypothetical protein AAGB15_06280 [Pseudomonadota bacterium]
MSRYIWLSSVETSEPVGIPVDRIALIEQKTLKEGNIVAIFLDTGKEVRVMESLDRVRHLLGPETG